MANVYNGNIKLNIFGESHAPYIGASIDGLAPGIKIDIDKIKQDLARRRPNTNLSNARIEEDEFEIISGVNETYTTGEELVILIKNKVYDSSSYDNSLARSSHADYTNYVKSMGYANLNGGGARSGRMTAGLVAIGSIAKSILEAKGLIFKSECLIEESLVKDALCKGDSIGAKVSLSVLGIEAGIGEPFFDSIESVFSHLAFSIPGVKAIEFGLGTGFDHAYASNVNDQFSVEEGRITTKTNNNGGINGGVSNGMPINCMITFKPTPTIKLEQSMLNLNTNEVELASYSGKHDACIALRCGVILECVMALALLDLYSARYGYLWMNER